MVRPLYVKVLEYESYSPHHFKRDGIELWYLSATYLEYEERERARERLHAMQPTRIDLLAIVRLLVEGRTSELLGRWQY